MTDETVSQQLRDHAPEALALLIEEHAGGVSTLAARILAGVGTREDVEECVSDVFVSAWNRVQEYDETRGTIRTWLFGITKYKALDMRRRLMRQAKRSAQFGDPSSDPVLSQVLSRERQEELVACIDQLEPSVRDVLIRRYLLQMTIEEIAEELGLTRSTVDNRLYRGRRQLREKWERVEQGGDPIGESQSR